MIPLARPEIGEAEVEAVARVLRTGHLVQGAVVAEFERRVAEYVGARHAVAVSSGTAALHVALLAAGVKAGDEVLVPDFTYPATANVVELVGARAVFADIELATFNIDARSAAAAVTPRTRAILPVHLFGQPADMETVSALARERGLLVIEDAACALGAAYRGRKCGVFGDVACFSFHPRKVITTGEGGMLVTSDDAVAERARALRNHGLMPTSGPPFQFPGLNYRLTEFQAAMGLVQLDRLEVFLQRRAALARLYDRALAGIRRLERPRVMEGAHPVWQSYVVLLASGVVRDELRRRLAERGIETTLGTYSVTAQPAYGGVHAFPNSRRAYEQSLCLPLHTRMADDDVEVVARALAELLS